MQLLANRLIDTNNALAATTFLSLQGRVARSLLSLAAGFGQDVGGGRILVRQKITQSDLAAMAGIARENVSRILKEWTRRSRMCRASPATIAWKTRPRLSARPSCRDSWTVDALALMTPALCGLRRDTKASVTSSPSAMKSSLARRGLPPHQPDGAARLRRREPQKLDALVAHLDIDRDLRHQRHAVAVGDHLHHSRKAGGAKPHRAGVLAHCRNRRAPGRAGNGPPRAGSAAAGRCRRRCTRALSGCGSPAGTASRNGSSNSAHGFELGFRHRQRQHDHVERAAGELVEQNLGLGLAQLHPQVGIAALQGRKNRGQQIGRDASG